MKDFPDVVIDPEVREFLRSAAADMMPQMEGSAIALIILA